MRVTVLFESDYGNTAAIADAIAEGLRPHAQVDVRPVDGSSINADLLVVGAPTHVHGLPSARSRKALEQEAAEREAKGETLEYHPTAAMRRSSTTFQPAMGARWRALIPALIVRSS